MTVAFHLAFPVSDLPATRKFYVELLGCQVGRESERWIDFNLGGNQISAHLRPDELSEVQTNPVDGDAVPVRHFGLVLSWKDWHGLADRLTGLGVQFLIAPKIRFVGQVGEQATLFLRDPCGNALEFKSFKDPEQLFARD